MNATILFRRSAETPNVGETWTLDYIGSDGKLTYNREVTIEKIAADYMVGFDHGCNGYRTFRFSGIKSLVFVC